MAAPIFVQSQPAALTVYLVASATGTGATGLTFSSVTCDFRKAGAASFTSKALTALNFTEIGDGWYEIDFTAAETDTLGNMTIRVDGATVDMTVTSAYVTTAPVPAVPVTPPDTVAVYGWVYTASAEAVEDAAVGARLIGQPVITAASAVLSSELVSTQTDSSGFFTLELAVGAQFDIFIPAANYRRTITVPASSTNLFDIEE